MWGMFKENGFWIAKKKSYRLIINIDYLYIALGKFRCRLIILQNSNLWQMKLQRGK